MLKFELQQPNTTIIEAGRVAYSLGILLEANPYRDHFNKLWKIGWTNAKRSDDKRKLRNGKYRNYYEPLLETPFCIKCSVSFPAQPFIESSYCNKCGDYYSHTKYEIKEEYVKKVN